MFNLRSILLILPRRLAGLMALALLTLAAGCQSQGVDMAVESGKGQLAAYRLGPGDKVAIKVFSQPDMSGEFEIGSTGQLSLPLVGSVDAATLTLNELQETLVQRLAADFLVDPKVSLEVINYRPFYILGQVNKPGSYPYQAGLNVRMAVALAGGYTRRAREEPVTLIRLGADGEEKHYRARQDTLVLPGDSIDVPRRLF